MGHRLNLRPPPERQWGPLGLVNYRGKLLWTPDGFGSRWLHPWLLNRIVQTWNPIGCWLYGHGSALPVGFEEDPDRDWHDWPGPWHCTDCCRDYE